MLIQSIIMAWESVRSNKLRSFLTMLGIIIGVMALVVMVSLVNGATGVVTSEISNLGNDLLNVSVRDDKGSPLRLQDLNELASDETIRYAAPTGSMYTTAKHGYSDINASVTGATAAYFVIEGMELEAGRLIKTVDVENAAYVAVLSHDAAESLFSGEEAIGKTITLGGRSFRVIGTLKEDDSLMSAMFSSNSIYIPYTVESRMAGQPYISSFAVAAAGDTGAAEQAVADYLLNRFAQDDDSFQIINMSSISSAMDTVTGMLSLLLGGIAAISLLVGGIGIMNIMLVSVTERTKEIGIRKAIGAGRGTILMQFLIEALMLALFGCVFGLLLSALILMIVSMIAGSITFTMSPDVVILAVVFSSAIGLIFGLYPANQAAKKHPIEALRYEG
ncbi:MAG: ABC transporter permease [Clostridia bacterium]|nr:ABC transporter permease [Clostridia bacterium]